MDARLAVLLALSVVAALALAGCSHSSDGSDGGGSYARAPSQPSPWEGGGGSADPPAKSPGPPRATVAPGR